MVVNLVFLVIFYGILTSAAPNFLTTNNEMEQKETSTTSEDISSVPVVTTTINNIPNSTDTVVTGEGRNINGKVVNTTYGYYSSSTTASSNSSLSGGAIAGIVIGVFVLICCGGVCGARKSGHWETWNVWVKD